MRRNGKVFTFCRHFYLQQITDAFLILKKHVSSSIIRARKVTENQLKLAILVILNEHRLRIEAHFLEN